MNLNSSSLEFTIDDAYHGLLEVYGLLKLRGDVLVLEVREQDGIIGIYKSSTEEHVIPLDQIEEVTYKKKWIGARIELRAVSMSVFDAIAGSDGNILKLNIKRKNRERAESMVSTIRLRHSEMMLRKWDDQL